MRNEFLCNSLNDTKNVAERFSTLAKPGQCFALHGDLGSGKTTFTKYFISKINPFIINVSSPTFTIIQTYDSPICEIWHADCYRLKSQDEFFELGLEEAIQNCITIIEWPEIIRNFLPKNTIDLFFEAPQAPSPRLIKTDFEL